MEEGYFPLDGSHSPEEQHDILAVSGALPYQDTSSDERNANRQNRPRRAARREFRKGAQISANNDLVKLPPDIKTRDFALHPCISDPSKGGSDQQIQEQGQATITSRSPGSGNMTVRNLDSYDRRRLGGDHFKRTKADGFCPSRTKGSFYSWRRRMGRVREQPSFDEDEGMDIMDLDNVVHSEQDTLLARYALLGLA